MSHSKVIVCAAELRSRAGLADHSHEPAVANPAGVEKAEASTAPFLVDVADDGFTRRVGLNRTADAHGGPFGALGGACVEDGLGLGSIGLTQATTFDLVENLLRGGILS